MELDERKKKILLAIIKTYLDTGEPVGSRTISKMPEVGLSSATIRNEMADLEELGYIIQPHTSAGRIPSDKGYRFYVDRMMERKDREVSDLKDFVISRTERSEKIFYNIAKFLAENTNYAAIVSGPSGGRGKVKFIQLSSVDEGQMLCTVVLEGNIVKNRIINTDDCWGEMQLDQKTLLDLNLLLNTNLSGLTLDKINLATITLLKEQAGEYGELVSKVLDAIADSIREDEDLNIYTSGATNIFKYPELSDSKRASRFLNAFEEKKELKNLLTEHFSGDSETGIQVYIGSESPNEKLKDCSVVTAVYDLGEGVHGAVGIVGPKRMDYEKVVDNLKSLKSQLEDVLGRDDK